MERSQLNIWCYIMENKERLQIIYYSNVFYIRFLIKNDVNLILDSVNIYATKHNFENNRGKETTWKEVDFKITTLKNGDRYIEPCCPVRKYDYFLITANRVVKAKKMILKCEEYKESKLM